MAKTAAQTTLVADTGDTELPEDDHKKRVVLRLSPDLYDRLVALADGEERSLHGQVVWLIKTALTPAEEQHRDLVERGGR